MNETVPTLISDPSPAGGRPEATVGNLRANAARRAGRVLAAGLVAAAWAALCPAAWADGRGGPDDRQDPVRAALAEAVRPIAARLIDPDPAVRLAAARDLGRLGPASASAVGDLLHAMKEPAMRPAVSDALARIGPAALPRLAGALDEPDPFYRVAVLRAIWEIADPAAPGGGAVLAALPDQPGLFDKLAAQLGQDRPVQLRLASAEVIARLVARPDATLGAAAPRLVRALVESLAEPGKGTQSADARALAAIGRPALPALITALNDKRLAGRVGAAQALGLMGPRSGQPGLAELELAVPTLIKWLDDEQWRLRLAAAAALGGMGPPARPAVPKLVRIAWFDRPPTVEAGDDAESAGPFRAWQAAERALIQLGPVASAAAPVLIEALKDRGSPRRMAAVETLAAIGPAAVPAAANLLELLRDPTWPLPGMAIEALANTGPAAVGPAIELLKGPDEHLAAAGAELVRRVGPQAAIATAALLTRLEPEVNPQLRGVCLDALTAIGPGAAAAVEPLARMIPDEQDADLRHKMFTLLGSVGSAGDAPLLALVDSSDVALRREAVGVLGGSAPAAGKAVPALVGRLGDEDLTVRMLAAVALGKAGAAAVQPLLEATRSGDANVRAGACEALGRVGPAADPAADRLTALLADPHPAVRASAGWALGRLGPDTLGDPTVRAGLLARLGDAQETAAVRAAAAESLGDAPDPSPDLIGALADLRADPKLAEAATTALHRIAAAAFRTPIPPTGSAGP